MDRTDIIPGSIDVTFDRYPTVGDMWETSRLPPMPGEVLGPLTDPPERQKLLQKALDIVMGSRNKQYGESEDNFKRIADHWKVFFKNRFGVDVDITPGDVGLLMSLMKVARLEFDPFHEDSWVDLAGYAAAGYQAQVNS